MRASGFKAVLSALFLLLVASLATTQAISDSAPIVAIETGKLKGVKTGAVSIFKGIPYAEPPVGARRWMPPAAPQSWSDVRDASHYGNACIQKPGLSAENGGDPGPISEDCLYLNVWTPSLDEKARLPVIVWIHGGAYVFGSGSLTLYDGVPMARKGVVFVTLNYRLGPLGFFAHPALEKGQSNPSYNFGLLDQVAALNWVRKNIAEFGGDPDDVTLMGQSAGAKSVLAHFASPLSRHLFKKGVALSAYIVPDAKIEKAREVASAVATAVGLNGANATPDELRKVPAERFGEIADPAASLGPVPIEGDAMLPRAIAKTFEAGGEARYPLIMCNTSDDASVVSAFGFDPAAMIQKLGAAGFALQLLYPGVKDDAELGRQALRDAVFTINPRWVADRHAKFARTYRGYFDYTAERDRQKTPNGVPHGGDVAYFLDTAANYEGLKDKLTDGDKAYAHKVSGYIAEFAKTGTPSMDDAPGWQDDRLLFDRTLVFGPEKIELKRNFMAARLSVIKGGAKIVDTLFNRQ